MEAVAESFCMFCGAPLLSEAARWEAGAHAAECPFWRHLAGVDMEGLRARGHTVTLTVQKCSIQYQLPP